MRKGILILGVILVVVGALIALAGFYVNQAPQNAQIESTYELVLTPNSIGSETVSITWSGGAAGTVVYLVQSATQPTCPASGETIIAQGTGVSGSLSATLSPGTNYGLYACNGPSGAAIAVTWSVVGLSWGILIGIIVAVVGILVAVVGMRAKSRAPAVVAPTEAYVAVSGEPVNVDPEPFSPSETTVMTGSSTAPAETAAGYRPPRICPSCGTSNDVWLTNCRKCKRPLGTTNQE
jgi:predicted RNA-binding Zn-ribbon protein involved in translation (DUF1610 family)